MRSGPTHRKKLGSDKTKTAIMVFYGKQERPEFNFDSEATLLATTRPEP
jgi:hypothetical protein